jgi:hypothetical protein
MARLIENVEGINASEWEFFQEVFDDDEVLELEVYGHNQYNVIELEVESEGGWCIYARWGVNGDEMAFMTLEEAREWLESEEGNEARLWGISMSAPSREL